MIINLKPRGSEGFISVLPPSPYPLPDPKHLPLTEEADLSQLSCQSPSHWWLHTHIQCKAHSAGGVSFPALLLDLSRCEVYQLQREVSLGSVVLPPNFLEYTWWRPAKRTGQWVLILLNLKAPRIQSSHACLHFVFKYLWKVKKFSSYEYLWLLPTLPFALPIVTLVH